MQDKPKKGISVVINTYNAEKDLEQVLESAKGFDEILICDMESSDSTLEICERHGCKIVTFPRGDNNIVEAARDFAIHSTDYEWVLVIDADELITPALSAEVHRLAEEGEHDAYLIPRRNRFLGSYEKSFRKDLQLRMLRQQKAKWHPIIHSKPEVNGSIGEIKAKEAEILHLQNRTISEFIRTYDVYTDHEITKRIERGKNYTTFSLLYRPFWSAFKFYVMRGGYKGGMKGFIHAGIIGMYDFFMTAKMLEYKLKKGQETDN